MLRRALVPALLLGLLLTTLAAAAELPNRGTVRWLDDGDSFQLASGQRVRLLGIDCPEHENGRRDRFYRRHFGLSPKVLRATAREALHRGIRELKGKQVRLEYGGDSRDRYGRLLAYVYLPDGRLWNRVLLEEGLAAVFRKYDFDRKQEFLEVEAAARKAGRGMWRQR